MSAEMPIHGNLPTELHTVSPEEKEETLSSKGLAHLATQDKARSHLETLLDETNHALMELHQGKKYSSHAITSMAVASEVLIQELSQENPHLQSYAQWVKHY